MNWLDIAVIATMVAAAVIGWKVGLVQAMGALIGAAAGLGVAEHYDVPFGLLFTHDDNGWLLGYFFFIVLGGLIGLLSGWLVRNVLRMLWLGWVDRLGGLAAGLIAGLAFLSVMLVLINESSHTPPWVTAGLHQSGVAVRIVHHSHFTRSTMPEEL